MPDENAAPPSGPVREPDFKSDYANNIGFEQSPLDLKIIFGEVDQSSGSVVVRQHTSMTVAWPEAKLFAYFIAIQLAVYEAEHGKITIPSRMIPPKFVLTNDLAATPTGKAVLEKTAALYEAFVGSL